jgi:asparagine synthase (glutamine-hydrolysing)
LNIQTEKKYFEEFEITENIYKLLDESVERRLVSDVPVGIFLSGGLDSSVVAHLMNKKIKDKVKAFTIGFKEENYNEFSYAEQATKYFNVEHHKLIIDKNDFWNGLRKTVYHFDEPVADPAAVALYYVSKLARDICRLYILENA